MSDYKELISSLRSSAKLQAYYAHTVAENTNEYKAADAIEQLVKERDAAIADLKELSFCTYCKSAGTNCSACRGEHWEWRGA